ncbi:MAG: NAD(P)H-hydrate dehydratase [Alphaproteobacteria bacterium]|jgi:NAD(P)H-hydrate epimerase|nr:NAD(P)H-hydrate dehydratase [Alphaproteobacteria bacterium]
MSTARALLSVAEMGEADRQAIDGGTPGITLMENAGAAIADGVAAQWKPRPTLVLAGPGNNGGDGFVAARLLKERGWPVKLALLGTPDRLKGDAANAAAGWTDAVLPLSADLLADRPLIIDALFGAGLDRDVEGAPREILQAAADAGLDSVAVDVPSGLDGDTGAVRGVAVPALLTVTFFRKKPGHLLMPGRHLCGRIILADIGIPAGVLDRIGPETFENTPGFWCEHLPVPAPDGHKYDRGHALVVGGDRMTGAARLAARGARRIGAGLVTIIAPEPVLPIYASDLPGTLVSLQADWRALLDDPRRNALLIGPGAGSGAETANAVLEARNAGKRLVADADALTSFADSPHRLFAALDAECVLTPHDGEFARLFGGVVDAPTADRLCRARAAARISGSVVLLKGSDTVVAHPDGRAVINANAPPWLATGGSGDVLSGMILGLIAQGMPAFEAAAAAVWMHGAAAARIGPGLIAEDLVDALPPILRELYPPL